jgi:cold-inducible RNA-binding protein
VTSQHSASRTLTPYTDETAVTREPRMNIYVGNISFDVTEADLRSAFEAFGTVASANIIKDQYSGQARGFGFVEMPSDVEGQAAIAGLNGQEFMGRTLNMNVARPREGGGRAGGQGGRGGSGGGRGGGGGGGRGGYRGRP